MKAGLRLFLLALALALPVGQAAGESTVMGDYRGAKPTEYPAWFKDSFLEFAEDVREAAAAGKRMLVLFHQDGCPYCNVLVERNLSQKDIEQTLRERFEVVAVNLWGDRQVVTVDGTPYSEKQLGAAWKVQFTPTLVFFDEQGRQVLRLNGYLPPERFRLALDYVGGGREKQMSYREYVAANAPAPAAGELHAQDFFSPPPHDLSRRAPGRPLAVFFEQKQCPNCDTLHRSVLQDPDTRKMLESFTCVQLNMWSDTAVITPSGERTTASDWAEALEVRYAPSIVVFDPGGKEVIRSEAFFKTFHTQSIFDYVLSGAYRDQPSFQRYISERAERIREQGRDVDIWR